MLIDEKVQIFLTELKLVDSDMYNIVMEIRKIIDNIYPDVEEKLMYGGIVFSLNSEMFSGVFAYKKHVSIEFSNGSKMKDESMQLEGKGKYRRHLKIFTKEDIIKKDLSYFVKQAL